MHRTSKPITKLSFLLGLIFTILPLSVSATTVSPVLVEVAADPGKTLSGEITVVNADTDTTIYSVSAENFVADGEDGTPRFIGAEDGLATWIRTEDTIAVPGSDRATLPYTIQVPQNATPGGYFASIFLNTQNSDNSLELSIESKVGVLVLLRVNGDIQESANLREFEIVDAKPFYDTKPVPFTYLISNFGADRIIPSGTFSVTGALGGTVFSETINQNKGNVLPGSQRRFNTIWGEGENTEPLGFFGKAEVQFRDFHFGMYTAALDVTLGNGNQEVAELTFFMFPWQILTIVFVLAVIVAAFTIYLGKKFRSKLKGSSYMSYLNKISGK